MSGAVSAFLAGCSALSGAGPSTEAPATTASETATAATETGTETAVQTTADTATGFNILEYGIPRTTLAAQIFVYGGTSSDVMGGREGVVNESGPFGPSQFMIESGSDPRTEITAEAQVTSGLLDEWVSTGGRYRYALRSYVTPQLATQAFDERVAVFKNPGEVYNRWTVGKVTIDDRPFYAGVSVQDNVVFEGHIPADEYARPREAIIDQLQDGGATETYGAKGFPTPIVNLEAHYRRRIGGYRGYETVRMVPSEHTRYAMAMSDLTRDVVEDVLINWEPPLFPSSIDRIQSEPRHFNDRYNVPLDRYRAFRVRGTNGNAQLLNDISPFTLSGRLTVPTDIDFEVLFTTFDSSDLARDVLLNRFCTDLTTGDAVFPFGERWALTPPDTFWGAGTTNGSIAFDYTTVPPEIVQRNNTRFLQLNATNSNNRAYLSGNTLIVISMGAARPDEDTTQIVF